MEVEGADDTVSVVGGSEEETGAGKDDSQCPGRATGQTATPSLGQDHGRRGSLGDEVTGSGWDMLYVTCPRDSQEDGWEAAGCAGPGKGSGQETWPWESAAWRWDLKPGK